MLLAGIAAIYSGWHDANSSDPHNSKFIGRWNSDYSYPISNGTFQFKGMTEYFHNGRYNVNGVVTVAGVVNAQPYRFEYNVSGAGSWTADSRLLAFTLAELKSIPKSYVIDGKEIPTALVAKIAGPSLPNLSDSYASGASGEARILSVKDEQIALEETEPTGKPFTIQTYRQL